MILVTLRGAAAGWSPDTARAELWSGILDNSSRTQPPLSTHNNSGASLSVAAANVCTFAICHLFTYSKVKSWPTRPFLTTKSAINNVLCERNRPTFSYFMSRARIYITIIYLMQHHFTPQNLITCDGFLLNNNSLVVEGGELHTAGPRKGFY